MLVIQDPTNEQSTYLLESLLDAFHSANKIAGAFAFATATGVQLFTEDSAFREVAANHSIDLVVGIDAVTNENALRKLVSVSNEFPGMRVRAFLNPRRESLFHPKFCWTRNASGGVLICGSGNLTESGLLGNWEAYTLNKLKNTEITTVESVWDSWTKTHSDFLLPLDDDRVIKIARSNNVLAPEGDLPSLKIHKKPESTEKSETAQPIASDASVLIAEIPKSGNRWNQVNFHLDDYQNYFGVRGETAKLVVFRHVNGDGSLDDYERNRPPVTVKSRNFRFELSAAAGKTYPDLRSGRPIGIYIRVATRTFYYRLLLPDDIEYSTVKKILTHHAGEPEAKMRSVRLRVEVLREKWPRAPFWKLTVPG